MRRKVLVLLAVWTLLSPLVTVGAIMTIEASAAPSSECTTGPIIAVGRRRWCGYFKNRFNDGGEHVRVGGVPAGVNRAEEFITLIENDLASSNNHRQTGAQFVVLTMIGRGPGGPQNVSPAQLEDWRERVRSYANTSENGSRSTGENGRIDWFVSQHTPCNTVNTYYQVPQDDVAPFIDHPGNSDCEVPSVRDDFIIFRDTAGNQKYMIRRECMNPMGNIGAIDKPNPPDYNLNPGITTRVNGEPMEGGVAEVGDTLQFLYTVTNSGTTPSTTTNCTIYGRTHTGYVATPATPTSGSSPGYAPPPTSCPFVIGVGGNITVATETFTVSSPNQTFCRSLFVQPATPAGISRGVEECVPIANKPYVRAFGGDVVAGSGLSLPAGGCTNNTQGAVVGWNKQTGGFSGAGTQYATLALARIFDFATSLGNGPGAAPAPSGLAFANIGATPATGQLGGVLGSVPCIPNFYAGRPASAFALPATADGLSDNNTYAANGNVTLGGGTIDSGSRVTVYVKGNLFINGNITYGGTWDRPNIPNLRIIVEGDIFISRNVTALDGLYAAQQSGATGGTIYTCSEPAAPFTPLPLDGSLFDRCNSKLTVNGSFAAHRVMLLRTRGSLSQSAVNETGAGSAAGEVFNYGPAFWVPQPPFTGPLQADYNAIRSLPPIL